MMSKMDNIGRIMILRETRCTLNIYEKDNLKIFVEGESIILQKYEGYDANSSKSRDSSWHSRTSG